MPKPHRVETTKEYMTKSYLKIIRRLDLNREARVRSAVKDGTMNLRKRKNREACPNCEGKHDEVYQYVEKDKRWFCLCGWAEVRSKGTTTKEWRTACL